LGKHVYEQGQNQIYCNNELRLDLMKAWR